jgi:hypothetical protein
MNADSKSGIIGFCGPWPFDETVERIDAELRAKNVKLFARIDQAAVGLILRPKSLLPSRDPRRGTPLTELHPTVAMDLAFKELIWETSPSENWVGITPPDQPPTLVLWEKGDFVFVVSGSEAYRKDLKSMGVHVLSGAGHIALEARSWEIAQHMVSFPSAVPI